MTEIRVVYHNQRMLFTLDLQTMIELLLNRFGPQVRLEFVEMTDSERIQTLRDVDGLKAVTERFWLLHRGDREWQRSAELESDIVRLGRK